MKDESKRARCSTRRTLIVLHRFIRRFSGCRRPIGTTITWCRVTRLSTGRPSDSTRNCRGNRDNRAAGPPREGGRQARLLRSQSRRCSSVRRGVWRRDESRGHRVVVSRIHRVRWPRPRRQRRSVPESHKRVGDQAFFGLDPAEGPREQVRHEALVGDSERLSTPIDIPKVGVVLLWRGQRTDRAPQDWTCCRARSI